MHPIHTHKFLHSHVHTSTCTLASSSGHTHLFCSHSHVHTSTCTLASSSGHTHLFCSHSHVHTSTCTLASSSGHAHLFHIHMCGEPGNEFTCTHTQSTLTCIHLIYHIVILALGVCTHAPSKGSHSIHMHACSYALAHTTHPHTPTAHTQVSSEGGHSVQV